VGGEGALTYEFGAVHANLLRVGPNLSFASCIDPNAFR
jgi:hypothetical protein